MYTKLESAAYNHKFCRISFTSIVTIAAQSIGFIKKMTKLVARQPKKRICIFGYHFIAFYVTLRLYSRRNDIKSLNSLYDQT